MKLFIFQGSAIESNYGAGAAIIAESVEHAEQVLNADLRAEFDAEDWDGISYDPKYLRATEDECKALGRTGGHGNTLVLVEAFDMPHDSPRVVMFQENYA